jgi:hypothetical protein
MDTSNISSSSAASSINNRLKKLVASQNPVSTSYWTLSHIEAFNINVKKANLPIHVYIKHDAGIMASLARIKTDTHELNRLLANLKNKAEYEIRRICRETNSGHLTGLMVSLAEILRTPYKGKGGLPGGSLGEGRGHDAKDDGESVVIRKARLDVKYTYDEESSSGEQSSSGGSSFSQADKLRQKRMAQTEAATVRLAVEFLGMAGYYLEEELVRRDGRKEGIEFAWT